MKSPARSTRGSQRWLRPCAPDGRRERRGDGEGRPGTDAAIGGHAGRARRLGPDPGARTARPARRAQRGWPAVRHRPHCWPSSCARRSASLLIGRRRAGQAEAPRSTMGAERQRLATRVATLELGRLGRRGRPGARARARQRVVAARTPGGAPLRRGTLVRPALTEPPPRTGGRRLAGRRQRGRHGRPGRRRGLVAGRRPLGHPGRADPVPRSRTCEPRSCACTVTPLRRG